MKKTALILATLVLSVIFTGTYADKTGGEVPKTMTISGSVIDEASQEAIAGALVRIDGIEKEIYTDLDGNFTITGIAPDTYKIKCSMISYTECEKEIKFDQASEEIVISLQNVVATLISK